MPTDEELAARETFELVRNRLARRLTKIRDEYKRERRALEGRHHAETADLEREQTQQEAEVVEAIARLNASIGDELPSATELATRPRAANKVPAGPEVVAYAKDQLQRNPAGLTSKELARKATENGFSAIVGAKRPTWTALSALEQAIAGSRGYRGASGRFRLKRENR